MQQDNEEDFITEENKRFKKKYSDGPWYCFLNLYKQNLFFIYL